MSDPGMESLEILETPNFSRFWRGRKGQRECNPKCTAHPSINRDSRSTNFKYSFPLTAKGYSSPPAQQGSQSSRGPSDRSPLDQQSLMWCTTFDCLLSCLITYPCFRKFVGWMFNLMQTFFWRKSRRNTNNCTPSWKLTLSRFWLTHCRPGP